MRFFATFLGSVLAIAACYLLLAIFVDPQQDFNTARCPVVVMDSRTQKMRLFPPYQRAHPVQGLVIGSSRSMKLDPVELRAQFGGEFFNFAVDSARAEDYLAIYRWVRQQGAQPRCVIIGLDLDALHSDDVYANNFTRNDELRAALQVQPSPLQRYPAWRQLVKVKKSFSVSYLNNIRRSLTAAIRPSGDTPLMEFRDNGCLRYTRYEEQRRQGRYDLAAQLQDTLDEYQLRFRGMSHLSTQRLHYLEQVIAEATGDGAVVYVWITSFHPEVAKTLARTSRYQALLDDARARINEMADPQQVRVFDFSDPAHFGGDAHDWFDGIHVGDGNARKIVRHLAEGWRP